MVCQNIVAYFQHYFGNRQLRVCVNFHFVMECKNDQLPGNNIILKRFTALLSELKLKKEHVFLKSTFGTFHISRGTFPNYNSKLSYLNLEFWKLFFIFLNFVLGI